MFSDGKPRIIQIKGIDMEAEFGPHMLYVTNADKPGFIGGFRHATRQCAASISQPSISAATGRAAMPSRWSRSTVPVPPAVLAAVEALPQVKQARALRF